MVHRDPFTDLNARKQVFKVERVGVGRRDGRPRRARLILPFPPRGMHCRDRRASVGQCRVEITPRRALLVTA